MENESRGMSVKLPPICISTQLLTTVPAFRLSNFIPTSRLPAPSISDWQVVAAFPFPIQRIQTDRGEEFMAHKLQRRLMALKIKYRSTKPRFPHLKGKVECSQRTDLEEFYDLVDLKAANLSEQLQQ